MTFTEHIKKYYREKFKSVNSLRNTTPIQIHYTPIFDTTPGDAVFNADSIQVDVFSDIYQFQHDNPNCVFKRDRLYFSCNHARFFYTLSDGNLWPILINPELFINNNLSEALKYIVENYYDRLKKDYEYYIKLPGSEFLP